MTHPIATSCRHVALSAGGRRLARRRLASVAARRTPTASSSAGSARAACLCDSEINCGLESFWDNGFAVWLGHGDDPVAMINMRSVEEAAAWLDQTAREHYPDSDHAK